MSNLGIYIHVPFCESKCAYCDFYSNIADEDTYNRYTDVICKHITSIGNTTKIDADTLYFGGGTPSILGGKRIAKIIETVQNRFGLKNAEITVEVNPKNDITNEFNIMYNAGVNRISLGLQSAINNELSALSRKHNVDDVIRTIDTAKSSGFTNISCDIMLGIPHQTMTSLKETLNFVLSLNIQHVSCYMLKIEPNTKFGKTDEMLLDLPNEELIAEMYLYTSRILSERGFEHYEISNFAKLGYRSRHNCKYWLCNEYLGFGPSAHSFFNGQRFYYERDTEKYITHPVAISDGTGGDFDEYCMLRLRLSDGIEFSNIVTLFGENSAKKIFNSAKCLNNSGLLHLTDKKVCLTPKGFLLSNSVIQKLIY